MAANKIEHMPKYFNNKNHKQENCIKKKTSSRNSFHQNDVIEEEEEAVDDGRDKDASNGIENLLTNAIRLKLKKPKKWNWELTTSKSSPNIAFPRILLYDDKGQLLAEAKESDSVFSSTTAEKSHKRNSLHRSASQLSNSSLSPSLVASFSSSSSASSILQLSSSSARNNALNDTQTLLSVPSNNISNKLKNSSVNKNANNNSNKSRSSSFPSSPSSFKIRKKYQQQQQQQLQSRRSSITSLEQINEIEDQEITRIPIEHSKRELTPYRLRAKTSPLPFLLPAENPNENGCFAINKEDADDDDDSIAINNDYNDDNSSKDRDNITVNYNITLPSKNMNEINSISSTNIEEISSTSLANDRSESLTKYDNPGKSRTKNEIKSFQEFPTNTNGTNEQQESNLRSAISICSRSASERSGDTELSSCKLSFRRDKNEGNNFSNISTKSDMSSSNNDEDKMKNSEIPILVYNSETGLFEDQNVIDKDKNEQCKYDESTKEYYPLRKWQTLQFENGSSDGDDDYGDIADKDKIKFLNDIKMSDLRNFEGWNFRRSTEKSPYKEVRFDLQKSKSAADILVGNNQSPRRKRKCRRYNSSVVSPSKFSSSFLERMSAFKRYSSSSESLDQSQTLEKEIIVNCCSPLGNKMTHSTESINDYRPRYFLRSSRAGTLIVCEESFRHRKVRRRPRSCTRLPDNNFKTSGDSDSHLKKGPERVVQKFMYPSFMANRNNVNEHLMSDNISSFGKSSGYNDVSNITTILNDDNGNKEDDNTTAYYYHNSDVTKTAEHFDKSIAKLDKLISKVSLEQKKKRKTRDKFDSTEKGINFSKCSGSLGKFPNRTYSLKTSLPSLTSSSKDNNGNVKIMKSDTISIPFNVLKNSDNEGISNKNNRNNNIPIENSPSSFYTDTNVATAIPTSSDNKRQFPSSAKENNSKNLVYCSPKNSVRGDNKTGIKKHRKIREIRRCVSAGTVCLSSSDENDNDVPLKIPSERNSKIRSRAKRKSAKTGATAASTSALTTAADDDRKSKATAAFTTTKGDQILTLNNNYTGVKPIVRSSTVNIVDQTSNEIFRKIAQHLESFSQQQQQKKIEEEKSSKEQQFVNEYKSEKGPESEDINEYEKKNVENLVKELQSKSSENKQHEKWRLKQHKNPNYKFPCCFANGNDNTGGDGNSDCFPSEINSINDRHGEDKKYSRNQLAKLEDFYNDNINNIKNGSNNNVGEHGGNINNPEEEFNEIIFGRADDKRKFYGYECDISRNENDHNLKENIAERKDTIIKKISENKLLLLDGDGSEFNDIALANEVNRENERAFHSSNTESRAEYNKENFIVDNRNMGSNVSRNTNKGLSGRRTQSSGNLYTGKHSSDGKKHPSGKNKHSSKANTIDRQNSGPDYAAERSRSANPTSQEYQQEQEQFGVTRQDRNKFCGSLPNHLDNDDENFEKDIQSNYNQNQEILEEHIKEQEQSQDFENPIRPDSRIGYVTTGTNRLLQQQQQQQQQLQQQQQQQQQQQYFLQPQKQIHQQLSPYNNSVSEKETASTSSESSTFKINQDKPDIQLKLPLTRSNFDPGCDQGYGSERSPEDEMPPQMPSLTASPFPIMNPMPVTMLHHPQQMLDMTGLQNCNPCMYNFITKDCTFSVQITKGPRGLGLSISGGIDSNAPFPGLIRIKRLFPHQAAWSTGQLQPGDIILEANGVPLTGLTNYEALEVLRTMAAEVNLLICRPTDEQYKKFSPPAEPPRPPQRTQQQATQTVPEEYFMDNLSCTGLPPSHPNFTGEFEIIMVKQQGSLGFTLRKEDESVLGHYVRALVREPATTDGRIKPGDKIVAVNDVPLSPMTHEQAVIFLRQAADTVKLRLYRDEASTPVAAMSPTAFGENKTCENSSGNYGSNSDCGSSSHSGGKKISLRPEAINLLSDLAYRKQNTPGDSTDTSIVSSNASPRRLKRGNNKHQHQQHQHMHLNPNGAIGGNGNISQSELDVTDSKSSSMTTTTTQYLMGSQSTSICSDSEQSVASQCSYIMQNTDNMLDMGGMPSEYCIGETSNNDVVNGENRPNRPNFLNLRNQNELGDTPTTARRPKLQFSIPTNAYELNNLDNDALDAPMYPQGSDAELLQNRLPDTSDFTSLPCETFLIACKTESDLKNEENFRYKNPLYQSAHVQVSNPNEETQQPDPNKRGEGNKNLLKWKGVVFSPDEENRYSLKEGSRSTETPEDNLASAAEKDFDVKEFPPVPEGYKIVFVELNRGWNSRLGFSLQPDTLAPGSSHNNNGSNAATAVQTPSSSTSSSSSGPHPKTIIKAIYSDSVAARDGRLRMGDQLLMVNDESVENLSTQEIIELLRILRGSIAITILRKESVTESSSADLTGGATGGSEPPSSSSTTTTTVISNTATATNELNT